MDTEILRQFAENERTRAQLKADLESADLEKARLQTIIVAMYSEEGVESQRIKLGDGTSRTIYIRRELWAGHQGDAQALCDALKGTGYENYVKEIFNVQSLSSLVKEMAAEFHGLPDVKMLSVEQILEAVPEDIRAQLKVSEIFKIGSRAG